MCHAFLWDTRFYDLLFRIDQSIADEVRSKGCSCGGVLHSARYPRKPRGIRCALDERWDNRLSFCCAEDGCRRRHTPASVRFLGRKVYLGVIIILVTALHHGLSSRRRRALIDQLDIPPQSLSRWRCWWRKVFVATPCWRALQGQFMPPLEPGRLPGALLGRLTGADLPERLCRLLFVLSPITVLPRFLPEGNDPQKM